AELRKEDRRRRAARDPNEPRRPRGLPRDGGRRMSDLLVVDGLRVRYGAVEALHGITFSAAEGAVTALIGANGAGKTTTLAALSGIVRSSGHVLFDRRALHGKPPHEIVRAGIVQVPEGRQILARMSVQENLLLGLRGSDGARLHSAYERFPILAERRHLP